MKVRYIGTQTFPFTPGQLYNAHDSGIDKDGQYIILLDSSAQRWSATLFEAIKIFQVKCIDDTDTIRIAAPNGAPLRGSPFRLYKDQTYDAYTVSRDYYIVEGYAFKTTRFAIVDDSPTLPVPKPGVKEKKNVDAEEERLRAMLTAVNSSNTCKSCNVPLPCRFHPGATRCQ